MASKPGIPLSEQEKTLKQLREGVSSAYGAAVASTPKKLGGETVEKKKK